MTMYEDVLEPQPLDSILEWEWGGGASYEGFQEFMRGSEEFTYDDLIMYLLSCGETPEDYLGYWCLKSLELAKKERERVES